jgi:hypothetical protein
MKQPKSHKEPESAQPTPSVTAAGPVKPGNGHNVHRRAPIRRFAGPVKGEGPFRRGDESDVRRKEPFDESAARAEQPVGEAPPPEQRPVGEHSVLRAGEGYVRLRLRVQGDQVTVIDSHLVEGPLSQPTSFQGAGAYEVTSGGRLVHAESVPDLGVQRSFQNLEGPPEQRGHYMRQRDVLEFMARVPAEELTPETLAGIRVTLHRVEEPSVVPQVGTAPLAEQLEGRVRPIAVLVGLPESALPEAIVARGGTTASGRSPG